MMGAMGESYKKRHAFCLLIPLLKALEVSVWRTNKATAFLLKIWPVARHIRTNFITGSKPSQGPMDSISRNTSVSHAATFSPMICNSSFNLGPFYAISECLCSMTTQNSNFFKANNMYFKTKHLEHKDPQAYTS